MSKRAAPEGSAERPPKQPREDSEGDTARQFLDEALAPHLHLDASVTLRDFFASLPHFDRPGVGKGSSLTSSKTGNLEIAQLFASPPGQPLAPLAPRRLVVINKHDQMLTNSAISFLEARLPPGMLDMPLLDVVKRGGSERDPIVWRHVMGLISYLNNKADAEATRTSAIEGKPASSLEKSDGENSTDWLLSDELRTVVDFITQIVSDLQIDGFPQLRFDVKKHRDDASGLDPDFRVLQRGFLQLLVEGKGESAEDGLLDLPNRDGRDEATGFGWEELSCFEKEGSFTGEQVMLFKNLAVAFRDSPFTCFSNIFACPSSAFAATVVPLERAGVSSTTRTVTAGTAAASSEPNLAAKLQHFPYLFALSSKFSTADLRFHLWSFYLGADSRHFASQIADMLIEGEEYEQLRIKLAELGYTIRSSSSILKDEAFRVPTDGGLGHDSDEGGSPDEEEDRDDSKPGDASPDDDVKKEDDYHGRDDDGDSEDSDGAGHDGPGEHAGALEETVRKLTTTPRLLTRLAPNEFGPTVSSDSTLLRVDVSPSGRANPDLSKQPELAVQTSPYLTPPKTPRSSITYDAPLVSWYLSSSLSPSLERSIYQASCLGLDLVLKYGRKDEILREAEFLLRAGVDTSPRVFGVFKYAERERYCLVQTYDGKRLREWEDLGEKENKTVSLHDKGIFHNDLAPRNVVRGKDGLKIIDFGMAREHECEGKDCVELSGLRRELGLEE
ncbi:Proteophosphoglycan ppg4 [Rhodotorula toruloides ATCC 204091]|uniref:BY PROTMAP: gi/342319003/gb/EGU10955.1/ Proteophosphoglycan ppg4 [Rhodotorula glutinis ATCC 204091] n=1 Tax=Rhodotorula toruloides TaxID=5286 RepID=A0A0K3CPW3_RHOTO|nr:Proteophosphoglycan ppg4 [Rhodotorula toruloides ATCC 204091]